MKREFTVHLPKPHFWQDKFIEAKNKRKIIRAGRRSGKTVGVAIYAVKKFVELRRVLYAAPTSEQISRFWSTVRKALGEGIDRNFLYKNETEHIIEFPKTEIRLRAKTAWNADTLRGDYADVLILDEFQLMNEDTWGIVGAPMLMDNNGDAIFVYTPPSLHSRSASKANDPLHAAKTFKRYDEYAKSDNLRYGTFCFASQDNPYLSKEGLDEVSRDMTNLAYRMEILAEDIEEAPGALWTREIIEKNRIINVPILQQIVVAIDPSASSTGDEAGIVAVGRNNEEYFVLEDASLQGSPLVWASQAISLYHRLQANKIVAEQNNGGEMITQVLSQIDSQVPVELVHASRGKQTRAEPIVALYEQNKVHHVGVFPHLEDEMVMWIPRDASPNRMDALVWALSSLKMTIKPIEFFVTKKHRDYNRLSNFAKKRAYAY
jgi:hypothetical protein